MGNPFQDQLLKAGMVSKQQVNKANKSQNKKLQKQQKNKITEVDEAKLQAQKTANEKAQKDRELNKQKEEKARMKAFSAEIDQLIENNQLDRSKDCEIDYNFQHMGKVKCILVNEEMKQQVIQGRIGIANIKDRYELIPKGVAEKIQQRDSSRVILFDDSEQADKDDPYADYQIPDDLSW